MARDICSVCGGPREPTSTSFSYCIECTRERQRERYRSLRKAAGFEVNSRVEPPEDRRRTFLLNGDGRPGACEVCREHEPKALELLQTGDIQEDDMVLFNGKAVNFALVCAPCRYILKGLNGDQAKRVVTIVTYLGARKTEWDMVLPGIEDSYRIPPTLPPFGSINEQQPTTPANNTTQSELKPKRFIRPPDVEIDLDER